MAPTTSTTTPAGAGPGAGSARPAGAPGPTGARPVLTPGLRVLWRGAGSVWAVLALAYMAVQGMSVLAHEEETVVTRFDPAAVSTIDVRNSAGGVHVVGSDVEEIVVTAEVSDGWRDTAHSQVVDEGRLRVRGSCPLFLAFHCSVTYRIEAPRDMTVWVRGDGSVSVSDFTGDVQLSTGNGSVEATRVDGNVDLSSSNGRVEATDIGGDLRMESDNGPVIGRGLRAGGVDADSDNGRVELSFVTAPRAVTARTDNGSVDVAVPDTGEDYRLDADSGNGTVSLGVDQERDSPRIISAYSGNGSVTVRYG